MIEWQKIVHQPPDASPAGQEKPNGAAINAPRLTKGVRGRGPEQFGETKGVRGRVPEQFGEPLTVRGSHRATTEG